MTLLQTWPRFDSKSPVFVLNCNLFSLSILDHLAVRLSLEFASSALAGPLF